jgi:hypothetical protein
VVTDKVKQEASRRLGLLDAGKQEPASKNGKESNNKACNVHNTRSFRTTPGPTTKLKSAKKLNLEIFSNEVTPASLMSNTQIQRSTAKTNLSMDET